MGLINDSDVFPSSHLSCTRAFQRKQYLFWNMSIFNMSVIFIVVLLNFSTILNTKLLKIVPIECLLFMNIAKDPYLVKQWLTNYTGNIG